MQRYCNGILRHTTGEERLATNWDVCKMECLPAPQTGGQVYSIYGKFNKAGANYSIRPNQLDIHEHSHARTHSTCILGRTELVDAVCGGVGLLITNTSSLDLFNYAQHYGLAFMS